MPILTVMLALVAVCLFIVNVYQYLTQRSALRIAEILYVMSRNVRERAAAVRRESKDVEILEAHLFDISTSARSLLLALGRKEGEDFEYVEFGDEGHGGWTDQAMRIRTLKIMIDFFDRRLKG